MCSQTKSLRPMNLVKMLAMLDVQEGCTVLSFPVSQHYDIAFLNNPNILIGELPTGMVVLDILDDMEFNEERTLSLMITMTTTSSSIPVDITINETTVMMMRCDHYAGDLFYMHVLIK